MHSSHPMRDRVRDDFISIFCVFFRLLKEIRRKIVFLSRFNLVGVEETKTVFYFYNKNEQKL